MKDTCKQAIFRRRYQESQVKLRISGQKEIKKRENWSGVFQHVYKRLVEYLEELWTFTEVTVSPEDQKRVFGVDKLNAAYQKKNLSLKSNLRLKSVHIIKMDEEKDDLKSINVYKFNNTKENWMNLP